MHLSRKNRKYAVNRGQSYGEWAEPNDVMAFQWYDFAAPHPEESTAYAYFTLKHILEIADILGKGKDKELEKKRNTAKVQSVHIRSLSQRTNFRLTPTGRQSSSDRFLWVC